MQFILESFLVTRSSFLEVLYMSSDIAYVKGNVFIYYWIINEIFKMKVSGLNPRSCGEHYRPVSIHWAIPSPVSVLSSRDIWGKILISSISFWASCQFGKTHLEPEVSSANGFMQANGGGSIGRDAFHATWTSAKTRIFQICDVLGELLIAS